MFGRPDKWRNVLLAGALLTLGCGDNGAGTETGTGTGTETGTGTTTGTTTEQTPTTTDTTTGVGGMCNPTAQDCDPGQKCVAYDSPEVEDTYWDANACVPEPMNPAQEGDTCNIDMGESVFSGLDNCAAGTICLNFDFETGQGGSCTAYCGAGNSCDADEVCVESANMGVLPICLPGCNPILQDCPDMQGCYGDPSLDGFICFSPDPGMETGLDGSPCQFTNACMPGFSCQAAETLEGCMGAEYCCTPFCTVSEGDAACAPTEDCVPFYASDPPPGLEDIGVCAIPG